MSKDELIAAFEALTIEDIMAVVQQIMPDFCTTVMQDDNMRQQMMSSCQGMIGRMNMPRAEMMQLMKEMMCNG